MNKLYLLFAVCGIFVTSCADVNTRQGAEPKTETPGSPTPDNPSPDQPTTPRDQEPPIFTPAPKPPVVVPEPPRPPEPLPIPPNPNLPRPVPPHVWTASARVKVNPYTISSETNARKEVEAQCERNTKKRCFTLCTFEILSGKNKWDRVCDAYPIGHFWSRSESVKYFGVLLEKYPTARPASDLFAETAAKDEARDNCLSMINEHSTYNRPYCTQALCVNETKNGSAYKVCRISAH